MGKINKAIQFMPTTGYSGTQLAKKLGIKQGLTIKLINAPGYYLKLFPDFPSNTKTIKDTKTKVDFIHFFPVNAGELNDKILSLKKQLQPDGMIWISWYKKSAKIPTDVTEDIIRSIALKNGLVDIKVCAVDELWSGLKLVIPVKDRIVS
jgi:Protein of unknown function (DUF3052)